MIAGEKQSGSCLTLGENVEDLFDRVGISESVSRVGAVHDLGDRGQGLEMKRMLRFGNEKQDDVVNRSPVESAEVNAFFRPSENRHDIIEVREK